MGNRDSGAVAFQDCSCNNVDMSVLTIEQQDALHNAKGPVRLEDPPTPEEQAAFLGHFAAISGWDDPALDVYNYMK